MIYYEFTPESAGQPPRLELVGDSAAKIKKEHQGIVSDATQDFLLGLEDQNGQHVTADEVYELNESDPTDLPIDTVAKIYWQEPMYTRVVNKFTGLDMGYDENGLCDFIFEDSTKKRISKEDALRLSKGMLGLILLDHIYSDDCKDYARALQIETEHGRITSHMTLGHKDDSGSFVPVLTILDEQHPARQMIE